MFNSEKNKRFELLQQKHLNNESNLRGNWSYKGNNLTLIYDKPKFRNSNTISVSRLEEMKDSIDIIFRIKDFNEGAMLGLKIKIFPENYEYLTKQKGEKRIVFKKQNKLIYGYTEYLGYEKCHFSFDLNESYIIDIKINRNTKEKIDKSIILKNFKFNNNSFFTTDEKRKKEKWVKCETTTNQARNNDTNCN